MDTCLLSAVGSIINSYPLPATGALKLLVRPFLLDDEVPLAHPDIVGRAVVDSDRALAAERASVEPVWSRSKYVNRGELTSYLEIGVMQHIKRHSKRVILV